MTQPSDTPWMSDALLLALECSGEQASTALLRGAELLAAKRQRLGRDLSERLLPLLGEVLEEAGAELKHLAGLGVSVGPGSFTGLRVGLATVKGLAAAVPELRVAGVGTLEALAFGSAAEGELLPLMDARSGRLYVARYACRNVAGPQRRIEEKRPPQVIEIEALVEELSCEKAPPTLLGEGVFLLPDAVRRAHLVVEGALPDARAVAELVRRKLAAGRAEDPEALVPLYLGQAYYAAKTG